MAGQGRIEAIEWGAHQQGRCRSRGFRASVTGTPPGGGNVAVRLPIQERGGNVPDL